MFVESRVGINLLDSIFYLGEALIRAHVKKFYIVTFVLKVVYLIYYGISQKYYFI
jgi:hypothetical protein